MKTWEELRDRAGQHMFVPPRIHTWAHMHKHAHTDTYMATCTHMYTNAHTCTYIIYARTDTRRHIQAHTRTHSSPPRTCLLLPMHMPYCHAHASDD